VTAPEAHRAWKMLVSALTIVAFFAPSTGLSQRAGSSQLQRHVRDSRFADREQRIAESQDQSQHEPPTERERLEGSELQQIVLRLRADIQAEELEGGPNSANLIDLLSALASVYQSAGHDALAAEANQRALEIVRRTHGLHSLEQARFLQGLIANARSIGAFWSAWSYEQELLMLAERRPDDLRTAEILHDTAEGRMDVLRRYEAGEFPTEIVLGCYYEPPEDSVQARLDLFRDCYSGSRRFVRNRLLREAEAFYGHSMSIVLENDQCSTAELSERLMELARFSYLSDNASLGMHSLEYLYACQAMNLETWMAGMETYVQIADWELLHSNSRNDSERALEKYYEAYESLMEQGMPQAFIEQLFSSATPIVLPAFLPNPLASEDPSGSVGYIDLAFEITEYGKGRNVQVLSSTQNSTRADERRLIELVLRNRFRPRLTNGNFADSDQIVVRHYLRK
jgi:hypothetical protein